MVEVDLLLEDDVDSAGDLLLYECACDSRVLLACLLLVEAFDLREVLDGSDGGVAEGELEVAVAVLPGSVPALSSRVVGSWHDTAVAEELPDCGEALDPIDLEVERESDESSDARNPQEALDVRVGDELGTELLLEPTDLVGEEFDLFGVE